jgi:sugar phosphate isomerase/epimerase
MTRRDFLASSLTGLAAGLAPATAATRRWKLGLNTYCLRFEKWNDRRLFDYCIQQKLDAVFLQDSLDPGVMDPKHWAEVKTWSQDAGLHLETGGIAFLPRTPEAYPQVLANMRKNIDRAKGMGSPIVRTLMAGDRYAMPPGPVEQHMETGVKLLRELRGYAMDAGVKIAVENHKDLNAFQTRELILAAGKEFVGSYLDTGNPVFVAEDPMTTVEELGPLAVCIHLRDSVVYEVPEGIAVQWVPLGEGTVDFKALVARAADILPEVYIYCKPITARPPVVIPVYTDEFWTKWFPHARARDLERFVRLAKHGKPYDKAQVVEDVEGGRTEFMEALRVQQLEHMARSLDYCRKGLDLGVRWRG